MHIQMDLILKKRVCLRRGEQVRTDTLPTDQPNPAGFLDETNGCREAQWPRATTLEGIDSGGSITPICRLDLRSNFSEVSVHSHEFPKEIMLSTSIAQIQIIFEETRKSR